MWKNGAGKSTFLQQIEACHPTIYFSPKVRLGTYHQLDYRLKNDEPLLTYLLKRTNYSEKIVRSLLYRLGFQQENLQTKISSKWWRSHKNYFGSIIYRTK